jgi:hypothetical protein
MAEGPALSSFVQSFLTQLAGGLPLLVVYLAGLVLTVILWDRQPRASLLVMLGLVLMLATSLLGTCLFSWLVHGDMEHERRGGLLTLVGFGRTLLHACGLCLVLAAVFVGRSRPLRAVIPPPDNPPSAPLQPSGPSAHITADRPQKP